MDACILFVQSKDGYTRFLRIVWFTLLIGQNPAKGTQPSDRSVGDFSHEEDFDSSMDGGATPAAGAAGTSASASMIKDPEIKYICGDCGIVNYLSARDPIRCRACGYRIMYKARTKRLIQFEAR
ncbi:hypothetical protein PF005_g14509 [Phytophthora fragariae]|uniref:DNA-directed RNA polymerase I, II, and III subunit RPABC4 n=3 Tax=Phytophthora TaxID=4783 RepID=A0A6A3EKU7_9STRA|nr:hypothetical protein PF003_g14238 [Phytophthora fragariae]KAE9028013.1 hypothetical protein PR002_g10517 [Phytophthora rubi]KAE8934119.1 hypothetical protein PF009_g15895 [Phytophthora fragariae]KAE8997053.1 hypothetical protein PF011_g15647 [Phytophthora fragariae]KAE9032140.1 hypothetical protein PR001_g10743 [Phytophthora rubi]